MYEGFDIASFLMGLPLAIMLIGIIALYDIKKGKKERRYDERYTKIHDGARSISWYVTSVFILLSWIFVLIYERPSTAFFVLTVLWIVHMTSYGIGVAILNKKM
ncbi:hypothetical protein [Pseudogracilibacillus sp. ICA-222130]|uniref:hypothetical protein n=1 Tax=Pseudogracilibacillus sp. ICA-222130 TaxID=3134655 RepID=UPI0030BEB711